VSPNWPLAVCLLAANSGYPSIPRPARLIVLSGASGWLTIRYEVPAASTPDQTHACQMMTEVHSTANRAGVRTNVHRNADADLQGQK
jgi:hypothetical protein